MRMKKSYHYRFFFLRAHTRMYVCMYLCKATYNYKWDSERNHVAHDNLRRDIRKFLMLMSLKMLLQNSIWRLMNVVASTKLDRPQKEPKSPNREVIHYNLRGIYMSTTAKKNRSNAAASGQENVKP